MNKTRTVFIYEFLNILRSRSFLLTLVLIPLAGLVVILVISGLQNNNQTSQLSDLVAPAQSVSRVGLIDRSGIVVSIPQDYSGYVQRFSDLESAQSAVEEGEISGYYLIPADYLSSGQVDFYRPDFDPIAGFENAQILNQILQKNLLRDNPQLLARLEQPLQLTEQYLSAEPQRDPNSELTFFLPYGITIMFYMLILGSSSTMLSSITNEKQNRVMEMLLTSMSPTQMLTGKILALGLIGLLQTTFWSLSGFMLLRLSGRTFNLPVEFEIPLSVLLWGILFFLLGYAMYASLMAGLGAMVPNLREGSQATFIVIMPLIIPMFFVTTLIGQPNGTLSVIFSLFPLTSPVAMMTRLAAVNVPFWQPLVAALLQAGTAFFIIRSISGMFRAQNLLTGQSFNYRLFFRALLGRA